MKASDAVAAAIKEIGTSEYPPNSNAVLYNQWYYGKPVSGAAYPWCAAFISWLFKDNMLVKKTASCAEMLTWFEKNGQIVKNPQAGDIVFFKYNTNNRRTNHVGIVIGVQGDKISTVEGNTSMTSNDNGGSVLQRIRSSKIVAYARPNYEDAYVEVKKGSKGTFVRKLQIILNSKYGHKLEVDGDYGSLTEAAVISTQAQLGIQKSGKADAALWRKIL